jgi:hypothetical protein
MQVETFLLRRVQATLVSSRTLAILTLPSSDWRSLTVWLKKAELVAKRESVGMPSGQST